jgi:hypothetical protein
VHLPLWLNGSTSLILVMNKLICNLIILCSVDVPIFNDADSSQNLVVGRSPQRHSKALVPRERSASLLQERRGTRFRLAPEALCDQQRGPQERGLL